MNENERIGEKSDIFLLCELLEVLLQHRRELNPLKEYF
jgi:hypothetical protein